MIRSSLTLTKKVALIQLRAVLEPKIQGAGLTWDQALTTVTMISLVCSQLLLIHIIVFAHSLSKVPQPW